LTPNHSTDLVRSGHGINHEQPTVLAQPLQATLEQTLQHTPTKQNEAMNVETQDETQDGTQEEVPHKSPMASQTYPHAVIRQQLEAEQLRQAFALSKQLPDTPDIPANKDTPQASSARSSVKHTP